MNLSAESTRALHIIEIRCAHILAHHAEIIQLTPTENEELPEDTIYKRSREAKTVSLVDKIDGFMSCLHEVLAGNTSFREPFLNYITIFKSYLED
ncbi:MAG: hypothetical protein H6767_05915 [Candidatus Peribacteria bacterium]|nr:MAG: hypothetical protein H6767_05915 [Candidatus Peribacteria bacterium]